ncbi:MAG: ParB/RepB/Spo0J family partition protein [Panacagrimonas sp.]
MSTHKKRGLGRDLSALLSSGSTLSESETAGATTQQEIALDRLQAGRHQMRRHFDEAALAELAASIAAQGVVQPIVVRPLDGRDRDRFEIVAGERRWRAAQLAGLKSIPAVVRVLDERSAMAVGLVENIQRADLNPLEEADALRRLIDECKLTHEQIAESVGRSRAAVTNLLRLMELNPDVQQLVRERRLSLGHAKVLLGAEGARQSSLGALVADQQLSVRQTEALVQGRDASDRPAKADGKPVAPEMQALLAKRFGLPVKLQQNAQGRGRITISFRSASELDGLVRRFT